MVKFSDLSKVNHPYSEELKAVASEVIDSGRYLFGPKVLEFETKLKSYLNSKHVVGVGNGLDALRLIFLAYIEKGDLKKGDEVLIPANTFVATILSIIHAGLVPKLIEPSLDTYNLDLNQLESKIGPKTKAIVLVHLYGRACWDDELLFLAEKNKLKIVEDNAQAFGAEWKGIKTGVLGHAAAFSFFPTKILGALGDAGAIATKDEELADIIQKLSNYGAGKKNHLSYKGFNSRMDELQAAFLMVKMKYVDQENQYRRILADAYLSHIQTPVIVLPIIDRPKTNTLHVWHLFVIRSPKRDDLRDFLLKNGIETQIHYPIPPHQQEAFFEFSHLSLSITEKIHREVISLPLDPSITLDEVKFVADHINNFTA